MSDAGASENGRNVFVVHGRDPHPEATIRRMLQLLDLNPISWDEAVEWTGSTSPSILEIVREGFAHAQAVVVIFSPDEVARLRNEFRHQNDSKADLERPQPRPNVLLEAGMALALHPERTLLLVFGDCTLPSDISGLHTIRFDGSV